MNKKNSRKDTTTRRDVELKPVEHIHPKQHVTYQRLLELPLGLLINGGVPRLKEGLQRVINHHIKFASSRLRVHQILRKESHHE